MKELLIQNSEPVKTGKFVAIALLGIGAIALYYYFKNRNKKDENADTGIY